MHPVHGAEICPVCLLSIGSEESRVEENLLAKEEASAIRTSEVLPPAERFRDTFPDDRYRILRFLGEGGMGEVYEAEQVDPIRRQVAIKVVKAGMDTREVVKRFEGERQLLSLMDHSGIAKVYDAGETGMGRPFFAMELVEGVPLTDFCREEDLEMEELLELFVSICSAIMHAHQKGVIHRDLKPTNLLVRRTEDGSVVPKVIDFGIAKAVGEDLLDRTLITRHDRVLGTPDYMSPEQARGGNVDTRTDIYALGCLLYELLTGTTPIGKRKKGELAFEEVVQTICEEEPERPSLRLARESECGDGSASKQRKDSHSWRRRLSGDLDWITLKALEKDPDRRYNAVSELTQDLSRFLSDQPVSAKSPSQIYLFRKFARRNRVFLTTSLAVLASMALGTFFSVRWAIEANKAKELAQNRLAQADEVPEFLLNAFRLPDPEVGGTDLMAVDVLDRALVEARTEFPDQPLILARVMESIGETYTGLGWYQKAAATYIEVERLVAGVEGGEGIRRRVHRAQSETFRLLDQREEAVRASEAGLEAAIEQFGRHSPEAKRSRYELALNLIQTGDIGRAQEIVSEERSREDPGTTNPVNDFADLQALIHDAEGRFEEAVDYYEQRLQPRLAGKRRYDLDEMWTLRHLARISLKAGEVEEAIAYSEELFRCCEFGYGKGHRYVVDATVLLARSYLASGNRSAAFLVTDLLDRQASERGISIPDQSLLRQFRQSSGLEREEEGSATAAPGESSEDLEWLSAEFSLAVGDPGESLSTMRRLIPEGKIGKDAKLRQYGRFCRLVIGLVEVEKYDEAVSYLRQALESPKRNHVLFKMIPSVSNQVLNDLCRNGALVGNPDLANAVFELAARQPDKKTGRMYDAYDAIRRDYLERNGDKDLPAFEGTMIERFAEYLPPGHHTLVQRRLLLGEILVNRKRAGEALPLLEQILRTLGDPHPGHEHQLVATHFHLARAYRSVGEVGKAKEALRMSKESVRIIDPQWWSRNAEKWESRFEAEKRALEEGQ